MTQTKTTELAENIYHNLKNFPLGMEKEEISDRLDEDEKSVYNALQHLEEESRVIQVGSKYRTKGV